MLTYASAATQHCHVRHLQRLRISLYIYQHPGSKRCSQRLDGCTHAILQQCSAVSKPDLSQLDWTYRDAPFMIHETQQFVVSTVCTQHTTFIPRHAFHYTRTYFLLDVCSLPLYYGYLVPHDDRSFVFHVRFYL